MTLLEEIKTYVEEHAEDWVGCNWTTQHGQAGLNLDEDTAELASAHAQALRNDQTLLTAVEDLLEEDSLCLQSIMESCGVGRRDALDTLIEDWESAAKWLSQVEAHAQEALASAQESLALASGNRWDDALRAARHAAALESEYGDDPTWGPLVQLVRAGMEEFEDEV